MTAEGSTIKLLELMELAGDYESTKNENSDAQHSKNENTYSPAMNEHEQQLLHFAKTDNLPGVVLILEVRYLKYICSTILYDF